MKLILGILVVCFSFTAQADEAIKSSDGSTAAKMPSEVTSARKDIDQEITNPRLRATSGAKKLLSIQSSLTYNGGSIREPLSKERPQLSVGALEYDPAKLTGTVAFKYRATDHDNILLGIGVGWLTPTYAGERGQFENPYLGYGRVFKAGGLQNVFTAILQKYTAEASVRRHFNYEYGMNHTVLFSLPKTKWSFSANASYSREFYSEYTGKLQDQFSLFPSVEYAFTPKVSFRTVYRGLTFYNTAAAPETFEHDDATESAGFGISVARDFYLYPNIQWVWADIKSEKTTVALSANINL